MWNSYNFIKRKQKEKNVSLTKLKNLGLIGMNRQLIRVERNQISPADWSQKINVIFL